MAVIYPFDAYRTPRLLSEFARRTGGVVSLLHEQQEYLAELESAVDKMHDGLVETQDALRDAEARLEEAHDAYDISEAALRSGALEDMEAARDRLSKRRARHRS